MLVLNLASIASGGVARAAGTRTAVQYAYGYRLCSARQIVDYKLHTYKARTASVNDIITEILSGDSRVL